MCVATYSFLYVDRKDRLSIFLWHEVKIVFFCACRSSPAWTSFSATLSGWDVTVIAVASEVEWSSSVPFT
jgi:hypothetical protein